MKIYRFDKEAGSSITMYNSDFILPRIVRTNTGVSIGCMHLSENGVIGRHKATCPQLLLIMAGEGEVSGENGEKVAVRQGDAVFWETGENHETTSQKGMTAIVIESDELDPARFMRVRDESLSPSLSGKSIL